MKKIIITLLIVVSFIFNLYAADNKLIRPTLMTNPSKYLSSFSLNEFSKDNLVSALGLPDKTLEMDGKTYFTYEMGQGFGKRQFVYVIENNIIVDVTYHDQGKYNGSSAKEKQKK